MNKLFLTLSLFLLTISNVFAQTFLSLEQAINATLDKNYAIKLAKTRIIQAENENTKGNAGMLPVVTAQATKNYSVNNLNQTFFPVGATARDPLVQNGVINNNGGLGVALLWTLYDGRGMYITKDRLTENVRLNQEINQTVANNLVAQVSSVYYDITRQQQRIKTFRKALEISTERSRLAKDRFDVGQGSKLDYLSAQVDYNEDKAALVAQEQILENSKVNLNALMNSSLTDIFVVSDTILLTETLDILILKANMNAQNPGLKQAILNQKLAGLDTQNIKSQSLPQLDLLGGATYNSVNNGAGFGVKNGQNIIGNIGLRASVNVFDGYNQKRRIQGAKINENLANLQEKDLRLALESALERTFLSYKNSLELTKLELENLDIAKQNVSIAFERYKIGVSTSLELREAQRNAVAAETRLIEAKFNAKLAEIELNRLAGK